MGDTPEAFRFLAFFSPPDRRAPKVRPTVPAGAPLPSARLELPFPEPDEVTVLPEPDRDLSPDPTAPPEKHFNHYSYFSDIEAAFVAHRGRSYHLSPLDWALIESWRKEGIPLPVVLRGIEQTFAARARTVARQAKGRLRPVRSLGYCQPAVEAAFQSYRAARVGAPQPTLPAPETNGPSAAAVSAFLESAITSLSTTHQNLVKQAQTDVPHAQLLALLPVVLVQLQTLLEQVRSETSLRLDTLELALSDLEDRLLAALHADAPATVLNEATQAAAAALKPHRKGMSAAAYAQAQANYAARLLRQHYAIPRLSLFHLEPPAQERG